MNLFETTSIITADTFKELKKHLLMPWQRIIIPVLMVICLVFLVLSILMKWHFLTVAFIAFLIILPIEYHWLLNRNVKISSKRMRETANADSMTYTTSLHEAGVVVKNHVTQGTATISYDNIVRLAETKSAYILFTKANQFIPFNKTELEQKGERDAFFSYLKQNCKGIRQ